MAYKFNAMRFFYDPDSWLPLLFPLPVLVFGQVIAHGFHFSMRLWTCIRPAKTTSVAM